MRTLHVDIETFSSVDLLNAGAYAYAESPDFDILLFGYAWGDQPVQVIDLTAETLPVSVLWALTDPNVVKIAHNANFERVCLAAYLRRDMPPEQWRCTAAKARYNGLPGSLEKAAIVAGLREQKDPKGETLIQYFSKPCKPTKANGGRTRNRPLDAPGKWLDYIEYCRQDVDVERALDRQLLDLPEKEQRIWEIDQEINDGGIRVDSVFYRAALSIGGDAAQEVMDEIRDIAGVENPNSGAQIKEWLRSQAPSSAEFLATLAEGLKKDTRPALMELAPTDEIGQVLRLEAQLAKTSITKYARMEAMQTSGGRLHGLIQYYGASRTGRWAGRGAQVHNLPRNYLKDLAESREAVLTGDHALARLLWGDQVPDTLSQLVRTAFIPAEGQKFIVSDFSSIEARVLAWLADESWALEVFRGDGRIYERTAATMFRVPEGTVVKGHENYKLRQHGKVAVLGLGYAMGWPRLQEMAKKDYSLILTDAEAQRTVKLWRGANKKIIRFWRECEAAAIEAVETGISVILDKGLVFRLGRDNRLWITLPAGRALCYVDPKIQHDPRHSKDTLTYYDGSKQARDRTYGGKLAENITQAVARDCLAESMIRLHRAGYRIVMHVHDEVVLEVPEGEDHLKNVEFMMSQPISWAPGLALGAAGFECKFYRKD